ncbi:hypothetical protein C7974DRAFT_416555 [Boeremia exigua]|uniref:uncharacterized protein n=1 Tax=Boeremia exigua TaxID=749465 RepID=UPI001E8DE4D1|nr:uncharacterized protein C7974DRAFT_416555 [Boeremia exigua]KAH6616420.1 hypothetical protein C7974DRAFT_416555 [Boeremia exigua]
MEPPAPENSKARTIKREAQSTSDFDSTHRGGDTSGVHGHDLAAETRVPDGSTYRTVPAEALEHTHTAGGVPDGGEVATKKRRVATLAGGSCDADRDWKTKFFFQEQSILSMKHDRLVHQQEVLEYRKKISDLELKAAFHENYHKALHAKCQQELAIQKNTNENVVLALQEEIIQKNLKINKVEQSNLELKLACDELSTCCKQQSVEIQRLKKFRDTMRPPLGSTSLYQSEISSSVTPQPTADHPLPTNKTFTHPDAPRQNKTFEDHEEKFKHRLSQGKVWPYKYGSNNYWDLGLCYTHFCTKNVCKTPNCEYRHSPLTDEERCYIRRLQPVGGKFLQDFAITNDDVNDGFV